jgi:hypothetical protein
MGLNEEERSMLAGKFGSVRRWAIEHQIRVGTYLGARPIRAMCSGLFRDYRD